jgi:hypothetical protein
MAVCQLIQPPGLNSIDAFSASHCSAASRPLSIRTASPECFQLPPSAATTKSQPQISSEATQLWLLDFLQTLSGCAVRVQASSRPARARRRIARSSRPSARAAKKPLASFTTGIISLSLSHDRENHPRSVKIVFSAFFPHPLSHLVGIPPSNSNFRLLRGTLGFTNKNQRYSDDEMNS